MKYLDGNPPQYPPEDLLLDYTLNNTIPLEYFYIDDSNGGMGTHYIFQKQSINHLIQSFKKRYQSMVLRLIDFKYPMNIIRTLSKEDLLIYTLIKDDFYYTKLFIINKTVAIIGSMNPWIEALCLSLGASRIVTFEYNKLTYDHPKIETVSKQQFDDWFNCNSRYLQTFGSIIAYSSLDHDGLGRYGDPLNPNGDIESLKRIADLLQPLGCLLLTVPVGPDLLVFNLHRRYGNIRLPLLLNASELQYIETIGWEQERLTKPSNYRQTYEPIFILQKTINHISNRCPNLNSNNIEVKDEF
jgi:hypothetical protein